MRQIDMLERWLSNAVGSTPKINIPMASHSQFMNQTFQLIFLKGKKIGYGVTEYPMQLYREIEELSPEEVETEGFLDEVRYPIYFNPTATRAAINIVQGIGIFINYSDRMLGININGVTYYGNSYFILNSHMRIVLMATKLINYFESDDNLRHEIHVHISPDVFDTKNKGPLETLVRKNFSSISNTFSSFQFVISDSCYYFVPKMPLPSSWRNSLSTMTSEILLNNLNNFSSMFR